MGPGDQNRDDDLDETVEEMTEEEARELGIPEADENSGENESASPKSAASRDIIQDLMVRIPDCVIDFGIGCGRGAGESLACNVRFP
jgi:hypothetical protein